MMLIILVLLMMLIKLIILVMLMMLIILVMLMMLIKLMMLIMLIMLIMLMMVMMLSCSSCNPEAHFRSIVRSWQGRARSMCVRLHGLRMVQGVSCCVQGSAIWEVANRVGEDCPGQRRSRSVRIWSNGLRVCHLASSLSLTCHKKKNRMSDLNLTSSRATVLNSTSQANASISQCGKSPARTHIYGKFT